MKISNVTTYFVEGIKYNWTLLKIETENGLHGWGEATNWPGSPIIEAVCKYIGDFITGQDARGIDILRTKLYRNMNCRDIRVSEIYRQAGTFIFSPNNLKIIYHGQLFELNL